MRRVRAKDTKPEIALRKGLWKRGVRYRKNVRALPGTPDIVLAGRKIAIFVDGDFWHARGHRGIRARKWRAISPFGGQNSPAMSSATAR